MEMENESQEIMIGHYELCYIVPMNYTTEELKPINEQVTKTIKEFEGNISSKSDLGKLKLAYPIKHLSHGYYFVIEFDMPKENLKKLNTAFGLIPEVLRFLIIKKKIKSAEDIKKEKELQEKLAKKKEIEIEKIKTDKEEAKDTPKKEKVSLEDLDKKLDEILDTDKIL